MTNNNKPTKTLNESFNETSLKRGQVFMIELDENPSTGHRWEFQVKNGKVQKIDDIFTSLARPNTVGGIGKRRMIYKSFGRKEIVIEAKYKRAWEKQKDAAGALTFKVKLK